MTVAAAKVKTPRWKHRSGAAALLGVLTVVICWARAEQPDDLTRLTILQLEQSRSKLLRCAYTYDREYEQHRNQREIAARTTGEWRQDGDQRWTKYSKHSIFRNEAGNTNVEDLAISAFIGNRTSGEHVSGASNSEEFLHDDVVRPSDLERKTVYAHFATDAMNHAFGDGTSALSTRTLGANSRIRWLARRSRDSAGRDVVCLDRYLQSRGRSIKDMTLTIDPGQSWIVIHRSFFPPHREYSGRGRN